MREALYYKRGEEGAVTCLLCPHSCRIGEGEAGVCRARVNRGGTLTAQSYGSVTSISLDPIEKKPLRRFYPGSMILSVGSYGCNFRCGFCQNHSISMEKPECVMVTPELLVEKAAELRPEGNIGLAYTYNEPLIGFEFVLDCARLASEQELKNVLVTNGFLAKEPLLELLPFVDAMNIDLKSFSEDFYRKLGGDLETVKRTITLSAPRCHVEVTTLVIPGENDGTEEMLALSEWLAGVDSEIPLHLTRFFPRYRMAGKEPTPADTIHRLRDIARRSLRYVYEGNL